MPTTISAIRILYAWHMVDGIVHVFYESTYVYNCFTNYISIPYQEASPLVDVRVFLGRRDRLYGNAYGTNFLAKQWQDYAKADRRYAGIDLTTLSLEIITVALAGPLALYVAASIRRDVRRSARGRIRGPTWFWAAVLATGELYGGLMNILPEWLSGNSNLDTEDPVHLWFHIIFFNAIWILFPFWVLKEAYSCITGAFTVAERVRGESSVTGEKVLRDEKSN